MQNDKEKIKNEFRNRIKKLILELIDYINLLPKTPSNQVIGEFQQISNIFGSSVLKLKGRK